MVAAGLADLDSISATRDASVSIAAVLAGGAAVCDAVSPGHPTYQAAASTSAAVAAPVTAEIAIAAAAEDRFGCGAAPASAGVSSFVLFPPDTSEASRSMVGGARLARPESGESGVSSGLSSSIPRFLFRFGRLYQNQPGLVEFGSAKTSL
jgi:hypothetical protein